MTNTLRCFTLIIGGLLDRRYARRERKNPYFEQKILMSILLVTILEYARNATLNKKKRPSQRDVIWVITVIRHFFTTFQRGS